MGGQRLGYSYGAGLVVLMVIFLLAVGMGVCSTAMEDGTIEISYQGFSLSIDIQKARVSEVFEELAMKTPYEIIVPEELLAHRVTLKCSGVEMDEVIRRVMSNAGVGNYALIYSPRDSKSEGPLYRVKVMLIAADFSGASGSSLERASFGTAPELAPGVSTGPITPLDSFPVARKAPVPQEMSVSRELSVELAPREAESLSEEAPTPAELSSEDEGFPVYRKIEYNRIPIKHTKGIGRPLKK